MGEVLIAVFVFFAMLLAAYSGYVAGRWQADIARQAGSGPVTMPPPERPSMTSAPPVQELSRPPSRSMHTAILPAVDAFSGPRMVQVARLSHRIQCDGVFYDRVSGNHYERTDGQGFDHAAEERRRAARRVLN